MIREQNAAYSDSDDELIVGGGNEADTFIPIDSRTTCVENKRESSTVQLNAVNKCMEIGFAIFNHREYLTDYSRNCENLLQTWELFFTFIESLVDYTNKFIRYSSCPGLEEETDCLELRALFGLLYVSGIERHTDIESFWKTDGSIFDMTMSYSRFRYLMKCLRFDDIYNRVDIEVTDNLAAIRPICDIFNENLAKAFDCGPFVTIGNVCNTAIRNDMVQVVAAVDFKTWYISKIGICIEQCPKKSSLNTDIIRLSITENITSHLLHRGRNVVALDGSVNFPMVQAMARKNTTIVGLLPRTVDSELKNGNITDSGGISVYPHLQNGERIVSSFCQKNSVHKDKEPICIPEIFQEEQNRFERKINSLAAYSVIKKSDRYALATFYVIMDVAASNGFIIHANILKQKGHESYQVNQKELRYELAKELVKPLLNRRRIIHGL